MTHYNLADYKAEKKASPLISLHDYDEKDLDDLASIAFFCKGKESAHTLTLEDFGPFTKRKYDGAQESEFLRFTDGSILIALLYGEHHYSEDTIEGACMHYYGLTPREKKSNG